MLQWFSLLNKNLNARVSGSNPAFSVFVLISLLYILFLFYLFINYCYHYYYLHFNYDFQWYSDRAIVLGRARAGRRTSTN